jgi:membrane protein implicated in regulation of membrane protease activity
MDGELVGKVGTLSVATRGANGPGEVLIKIRGGSEAFLAWSDEPLPKGTAVLVLEARGARSVSVVRWTDPTTPLLGFSERSE